MVRLKFKCTDGSMALTSSCVDPPLPPSNTLVKMRYSVEKKKKKMVIDVYINVKLRPSPIPVGLRWMLVNGFD